MADPLVSEALKKAAVAWVSVDGGPALALWCLPIDDALYVVSGPGEQAAPGLAYADEARVSLRGDHGGRIVTWSAEVTRIDPRSEEWTAVVPQLAGKRLNAPGSATALAERWAAECSVNRLAPAGDPEPPGDASEAAPPRESPAARPARRPFRLHRVRGARP
ncbi:hypothetical protein RB614_19865 [Phytohabitans sp. ZYX-F-186]|uniref:Pyridoxamine 5'-phosphate oxidase putative domain-containing protein n=1 Tax=Phytohabitans maris TaxID=3071409 RepID=A0ABU0ZIC4_9ACTN|nr:hypothetical protein [Phytohabitans sp. ZYX-F-186]MDQ7906777.1 hypothetical protein [Phytohabitans sp. ZYX-F-186]